MPTQKKLLTSEKTRLEISPQSSTPSPVLSLGIESSCDETSAAIVSGDREILSHIIYSQIPQHQKYGGVVPELAARAHILAIDEVVCKALADAGKTINDIDVIAATAGPGLIGGVIVGWEFATGLAQATGKPLVAVNHLEGHALVPRLIPLPRRGGAVSSAPGRVDKKLHEKTSPSFLLAEEAPQKCHPSEEGELNFPYLLLLASGGHSQILLARGVGDYEIIGQTLDDSAGEAFDKVAKMLGLGYPGGPIVDERAALGDECAFKFPRPLCDKPGCDFSFSGIKTAVRTAINNAIIPESKFPSCGGVGAAWGSLAKHEKENINKNNTKSGAWLNHPADCEASALSFSRRREPPQEGNFINNVCASFQAAVVDVIINRLQNALRDSRVIAASPRFLVVAGGVAKNSAIRAAMEKLALDSGMDFAAPPLNLCTDNGAMIAWAGLENYRLGRIVREPVAPRPRWSLTENSCGHSCHRQEFPCK